MHIYLKDTGFARLCINTILKLINYENLQETAILEGLANYFKRTREVMGVLYQLSTCSCTMNNFIYIIIINRLH